MRGCFIWWGTADFDWRKTQCVQQWLTPRKLLLFNPARAGTNFRYLRCARQVEHGRDCWCGGEMRLAVMVFMVPPGLGLQGNLSRCSRTAVIKPSVSAWSMFWNVITRLLWTLRSSDSMRLQWQNIYIYCYVSSQMFFHVLQVSKMWKLCALLT